MSMFYLFYTKLHTILLYSKRFFHPRLSNPLGRIENIFLYNFFCVTYSIIYFISPKKAPKS